MAWRVGKQWLLLSIGLVAFLLLPPLASAMEVQLAGIRLEAPWNDVVDAYGQPDAVALYQREQGAGGRLPVWTVPVRSVLDRGEAQWFYRKAEVVVGFVFDIEGCVRMIAVAGDAAGTPTWRPHRYVEFGDTWKRILYHYRDPDKLQRFGDDPGGPEAPIDAEEIVIGDWLFTYSEDNNIGFVTHNGQVARIHIWKPAE